MDTLCKLAAVRAAAEKAADKTSNQVTVSVRPLREFTKAGGDEGTLLGHGKYVAEIRYAVSKDESWKHALANDDPVLAVSRAVEHALRLLAPDSTGEPKVHPEALQRMYVFKTRFDELVAQKALVIPGGDLDKWTLVVFEEELEPIVEKT